MNKLDELYNKAIAANAGRKEAAQKNVNEVLSVLFAEIPSLDQIRVRGWTPGFNDGDPCTHIQEVAVGDYDPWGTFDDNDEDEDEDEEDGEKSKDDQDVNDEDHPEHLAYKKAHKIVEALDDDFATLFNTNFELSISRSDAKLGFTIHEDDYYCGY